MSPFATVLATLLLATALPPGRAQSEAAPPSMRMVRGQVVAVDPARRLVLLRHEEVRSLGMPEMQMDFLVPEGTPFPDLRPGDKVRFAVVRVGGQHVITRVAALPPKRGSAVRRDSPGAARADPAAR